MSGVSFPQVPVTGLTAIADRNVLGNVSGTSAIPTGVTSAQLTGLINAFTTASSGAVSASGTASATSYLNASGVFTAVPTGALTLLATQTASASTALIFTGLTTAYPNYEFVLQNITPSAGGTLGIQVSTSNGASYINTNYLNSGATSTTLIYLGLSISATTGISGQVLLSNPGSANLKLVSGNVAYLSISGPTVVGGTISGWWNNATSVINAVQFAISTGTLTTGSINMYGLQGNS